MPSIDVAALLQARAGEELALNDRHLNPQLGRILRTLGFDKVWTGGEGAHLIDSRGEPTSERRRARSWCASGRSGESDSARTTPAAVPGKSGSWSLTWARAKCASASCGAMRTACSAIWRAV